MKNINKDSLQFSGPAIYRIIAQGEVPAHWLDQFGDLKLTVVENDGDSLRSILEGEIRDQAQLAGILHSLYNLHLSVMQVTWLKPSSTTESNRNS